MAVDRLNLKKNTVKLLLYIKLNPKELHVKYCLIILIKKISMIYVKNVEKY